MNKEEIVAFEMISFERFISWYDYIQAWNTLHSIAKTVGASEIETRLNKMNEGEYPFFVVMARANYMNPTPYSMYRRDSTPIYFGRIRKKAGFCKKAFLDFQRELLEIKTDLMLSPEFPQFSDEEKQDIAKKLRNIPSPMMQVPR
jgi:hypothetical protein